MGELVTSHGQDLIFQPTESLAAKVIIAEQRTDELYGKLEETERKYQNSRLRSFGWGGAALAAAVGAGMIWMMASAQIASAEQARDKAIGLQVAAEKALEAEETVTRIQKEDLENLRDYEEIAQNFDKVKNVHIYTLDWYNERVGDLSKLPPNVREALQYDPVGKERLKAIKRELQVDEAKLAEKVEIVETYIKTRLKKPIEQPTCYEDVIFSVNGKKCTS